VLRIHFIPANGRKYREVAHLRAISNREADLTRC
jgi:hypothetical protein